MAITVSFQPDSSGTITKAGNPVGSIDPRLSRTNYFDGQLLKASDLARDQIYLDERLLEVGQAFGSGISEGLELSLQDNHLLVLRPGLAIAPSGRVLQLSGRTLQVDLFNAALISTLNEGKFRRLPRGLYAVALQHTEVINGTAEAYPADLQSSRVGRVSAYAEGVEMVLVLLPVALPRGDGLSVRAALARQLVQSSSRLSLPSDDAVALGLLAIEDGRPAWLDLGLVRRSLRPVHSAEAIQQDLGIHYRELYAAVLAARESGGQRGGFPAAQYFRLLPASGPLPKAAIDPVGGTQTFFPPEYEVSVAPVRKTDLPAILSECARLAPIDLERDKDVDVMVLVPLDEQAFALRARQLESDPVAGPYGKTGLLARIDVLALRLFTRPAVHPLDTDSAVWKQIWAAVAEKDLLFVRRPPRTAETSVSALVLARGFGLPTPENGLPPDVEAMEARMDEALTDAANAQAEAVRLAKNNEVLKDSIAKLEKALALGSDTRLTDALAQVQKLEADLASAQARIDSMISGERNAAILATGLAASADKITALQDELELTRKKLADAQAGGAAASEETRQRIEALNEALKASEARIAELEQALLTAGNLQTEAQQNLAKLTEELEETRKKLEEASGSAGSNDEALKGALAEIENLTAKLKDQQGALDLSQARLTKANADADAARQDAVKANTALSAALANVSALQAQFNTQKAVTDKALADLDTARKALAAAQSELANRPSLAEDLRLTDLAVMRGSKAAAAERLEKLLTDNDADRLAAVQILTLVDRSLDEALWPSLSVVAAEPKRMQALRDGLVKLLAKQTTVPKIFLEIGPDFGITGATLERWKALAG